jgi:hypothetical protein
VAVLSGEAVRVVRCVLRFAFLVVVLTVVVVVAMVGLVEVARVGMGRVESRCAVLGCAELG